jgi:hypothetical protein
MPAMAAGDFAAQARDRYPIAEELMRRRKG